jgi:glyoxylase-like metal-dependent hydrolase (beta-lactamase superfamily II)
MRRLREVSPGLLVATGELFVTNSTAVAGQDGGCLLIDPAVTVAELRLLAADLARQGLAPQVGFATHAHWDHVLWCAELGGAPRLATARAASEAERDRPAMIAAVRDAAPGHDLDLFGRVRPLEPGQDVIRWDGPQARVLAHDGHSPGHGAVFLPDSGVLIAGDMCSDIEIPLLDLDAADPVGDYRAGLELLAGLAGVRLVIPGHGSIGDAAALRVRLTADFRYLDALERGEDFGDSRLGAGWLRAAHERQLRHARGQRA